MNFTVYDHYVTKRFSTFKEYVFYFYSRYCFVSAVVGSINPIPGDL